MFNRKSAFAALIALGALAAGSAHAGNVQWSVSVNLPPVGTVVSNAPVYHPAPVYYEPAPRVVYRPAPVVYQPAPVYYRPAPVVVYRPVPVMRPAPGHHHHHHHDRWDDRRGHRGDHWDRRGGRDDRDDRGPRHGRH